MLEYTVEDAKALLTKNADNARSNVKVLDEDLVFLRDQIVTTEVSIRFRRVSLVLLSSCGAGTERGGGGMAVRRAQHSGDQHKRPPSRRPCVDVGPRPPLADIARVHNWDVKQRRLQRAGAA